MKNHYFSLKHLLTLFLLAAGIGAMAQPKIPTIPPTPAKAAKFGVASINVNVTSGANNGAGSLRSAINQVNANGGGTIYLKVPTITLTSELPPITESVSIIGKSPLCVATGAGGTVIKRSPSAPEFRILTFQTYQAFVTVEDLVIQNGKLTNDLVGGVAMLGGGLFQDIFVMNRCIVENCQALYGGGIGAANCYATSISNCIFRNNKAIAGGSGGGGGGFLFFNEVNSIVNSTFTNNSADGFSGGMAIVYFGYSYVGNSTFSNNTANSYGSAITSFLGSETDVQQCTFTQNNCTNAIPYGEVLYASANYAVLANNLFANNGDGDNDGLSNLYADGAAIVTADGNVTTESDADETFFGPFDKVGQSLTLGALADNGGCALTHAISCNSPAHNAGFYGLYIPTVDQRGFNRDAFPDAGAYEAGLIITQQPTDVNTCPGPTVSFSVATISSDPGTTYQWRKNGSNISNGGRISGATSPTLTITGVQASDDASYSVRIVGECDIVYSSPATLTVTPSPSLGPSSNSPVKKGLVIDLKANTTGATYKWTGPDGWTSALKDPSRGNCQYSMSGVYTLQIGASGGCISTGTVNVQVVSPSARMATAEEADGSNEIISVTASPNPTDGMVQVTVKTKQATKLNLQLLDILGREVKTLHLDEETTEHTTQLDISREKAGMYFLKATAGDKYQVKRVLKADR